tara:strand:+ start:2833 stop:3057 length:225 start_codon:yes stop_codon:yes gene_type:complete
MLLDEWLFSKLLLYLCFMRLLCLFVMLARLFLIQVNLIIPLSYKLVQPNLAYSKGGDLKGPYTIVFSEILGFIS